MSNIGRFDEASRAYFLGSSFLALHSFLALFSGFLQSTFSAFLSSILPPPWLMAKLGAEIRNMAEAKIDRVVFMVLPFRLSLRTGLGGTPSRARPNAHRRRSMGWR